MNQKIKKLQENKVPAKNQNFLPFYSYDDNNTGKKILFVGNSITKHSPKPEMGWENDCGMAASSLENDYVHIVMKKVKEIDSNSRFAIHVTWEIEGNFENFNPEKMKSARDYNADIIVFFFGANVAKDYSVRTDLKQSFSEACVKMRNYINPDNTAKCFWLSGFYIRPEIDEQKKIAAKKCDDVYIELGDIPFREETHGKFNHPNDLGMVEIANVIFETIKNYL